MDFEKRRISEQIRSAVRELCADFPGEYWRGLEPDRYPEEFVAALTESGWLAALIPEEYGGAGLGAHRGERDPRGDQRLGRQRRRLPRADVHDGHAAAPRHATSRRQRYLPQIAARRAAAAGVRRHRADRRLGHDADPDDAPKRVDGGYVVDGQKIWTSRALHSDLMLLLARTTPLDEVEQADRRASRCSSSTCATARRRS